MPILTWVFPAKDFIFLPTSDAYARTVNSNDFCGGWSGFLGEPGTVISDLTARDGALFKRFSGLASVISDLTAVFSDWIDVTCSRFIAFRYRINALVAWQGISLKTKRLVSAVSDQRPMTKLAQRRTFGLLRNDYGSAVAMAALRI